MGRLLTLEDVKEHAKWYFTDAYYTNDGRGHYIFAWPSKDYPYSNCIHMDDLTNELRIKIRRWVESSILDTVIYDTIDRGYRKNYDENRDWNRGFNVSNNWTRFFFENSESSMLFKLVFSDSIKEPTAHNPRYPDDEEWLKNEGMRS